MTVHDPDAIAQLRTLTRGMDAAQIARIIAVKRNLDRKARGVVAQRWSNWLAERGLKTLQLLSEDLPSLGLRLTVEVIEESNGDQ